MDRLVIRSKKVAFMETNDGDFVRMKGFTALATNKNPEEYTRKYVDEDSERTDVVGMSVSMDYEFDLFEDNPVHQKIVSISDEERLGDDAVVNIVVVDFTKKEGEGYVATKRPFAVIPETEGDSDEAYTYSGTLRVNGNRVKGIAISDDNWLTCTFIEDAIE